MKDIKENMMILNKFKNKLTRQQYKTFKGQILNGDMLGFRKGIRKVLNGSNNNI